MSEYLISDERYLLSKPFRPCRSKVCRAGAYARTEENRVAPFRMRLRVAAARSVRQSNFLLKVDDWELRNNLENFNLKASPAKTSITDLAPEIVEKIFDFARDHVASICLAVTCKRLFLIFDKGRNKIEEARRWSNTSGPWKQKFMLLLAKGWIPQEKMKLCLGCWRSLLLDPARDWSERDCKWRPDAARNASSGSMTGRCTSE